jgi:hypothetical protein
VYRCECVVCVCVVCVCVCVVCVCVCVVCECVCLCDMYVNGVCGVCDVSVCGECV